MELRKFIKTTIREYLNENKSYANKIKFETNGDYEIEIQDLNDKLNIINKYFPFNNVSGYYNDYEGTELFFDNHIKIYGKFNNEPFDVTMTIGNNEYEIDIHPFDTMGGFADYTFEKKIQSIYNEENTVSLVIGHEGYAVKSFSVNKSELDELKIYLVNGTQIEGKTLGETFNGKKEFIEK
jgi:hypothetical protein